MGNPTIAALMFPALFMLIFLGFPVSFSLIAVSFLTAIAVFGDLAALQIFGRVLDVTSSYSLAAIPLFIVMGAILERSGLAQKLLEAAQLWLGRLPGGLALATLAMSAVFAATTGIVGAVEVLIGLMVIPPMLKYKYSKDLISGTVCAGGSLGTIVPPSILAVVYGTVGQLPISDVLSAIAVPSLLIIALFGLYILVRCIIWPESGPTIPRAEYDVPIVEKLRITAIAILPALFLIVAVLGSIMMGIASPTEAAGVGALSAFALMVLYGNFSWTALREILQQSVKLNAMILLVVLGGSMFASVFVLHGGASLVRDFIDAMQLGDAGTIAVFLVIVFLLGFALDWISIVLICLPIFDQYIRGSSVDPLWFGAMMIVVIQTSYLTPPLAPAIFYFKSIAPPEFDYKTIFKGVIPFVAIEIVVLALIALFPAIALYLPSVLGGF